ncbi:MAG TPA: homoserine dehydrogenase [Planctomycetota bacterium]|nr:homoserine dehydrogenase [Planctomycetota bacterium]
MKTKTVSLLGCGTVGRGLVELIRRNRSLIAERSGVDLEISKILVRDLAKERGNVDRSLLTDQPGEAVANGADVVVEVIGGLEPARTLVLGAIAAGKHVVTANKALLADCGPELFRRAAEQNVRIGFEASVGGGIPIVRALSSGLAGNRIERLCGILNGTCNYILTRMADDGLSFEVALAEAQSRGFAEAEPSLDIDGTDAAHKLQILAGLAFGRSLGRDSVSVEGIRFIEKDDLEAAESLGFVLRHIAVGRDLGETLDLRVHPAFLAKDHPLAHVRHENNAVLLKGDAVGEMVFHGRGAGAAPTASAILSDVIDLARNGTGPALRTPAVETAVAADPESERYFRFPVIDAPGVIGLIATALGNRGISISHASASLVAGERDRGSVKILAHACRAGVARKAVDEIARLPVLTGRPVSIPIERSVA